MHRVGGTRSRNLALLKGLGDYLVVSEANDLSNGPHFGP